MNITTVVQALAADLTALGALGDEATAEAARRLAAAMEGPLAARLMESLGQLASELEPAGGHGHIEVRLVGADVSLVLVDDKAAFDERAGTGDDAGAGARITLRLPAQLKARIEAASGREGVSVNNYIVRALESRSRNDRGPKMGHRLSGYGRS